MTSLTNSSPGTMWMPFLHPLYPCWRSPNQSSEVWLVGLHGALASLGLCKNRCPKRCCDSIFECLASPSVTFVLSFFGRSFLHEWKGIPLPKRRLQEALQKNDTCLALHCCAWGHWTSVIFMCVRREAPKGLSGTYEIACLKRTLWKWHLDALDSERFESQGHTFPHIRYGF